MLKSDQRFEGYMTGEISSKRSSRSLWSLFFISLLVIILILLVKLLGISYQKSEAQVAVPLIKPDNLPYKIKIQNNEETKIANLDKEFFTNITKNSMPKNEKVLPVAEDVIDKANLMPEEKAESEKQPETLVAQDKTQEKTSETSTLSQSENAFAILEQASYLGTLPNENTPIEPEAGKVIIEEGLKIATNDPKAKKLLQETTNVKADNEKEESKYRLQIATFNSKKDVMEYLSYLKAKKPGVLGNLPHKIEQKTIANKGIFYKLQLGAFADRDDAKRACTKFKESQIDCFVVSPQ